MAAPSLYLSEPLSSLVRSKYASAQTSGALIFSSTHLAIIRSNGIPFQLRWCPALAQKPTRKDLDKEQTHDSNASPEDKKSDPFEHPAPELLVCRVPASKPTHNVVLNKYPVIAQHFILTTKTYKEQTDKLEQEHLAMAYACLRDWQPERLFAFFNSGEHSGASQRHRHIQFLPIEQVHGDEGKGDWVLLIDMMGRRDPEIRVPKSPSSSRPLPFTHFSLAIATNTSSLQLLESYSTLYEKAVNAVHAYHQEKSCVPETRKASANATTVSYNLAMTSSRMAICPRRSEAARIDQRKESTDLEIDETGAVALNGTLLAGTLMVKTEKEWNVLRGQEGELRLNEILTAVGIPWTEDCETGKSLMSDTDT